MKEQAPTTIKKNILLDWIYAQKNNIPVTDLAEFIKTNTKNAKTTTTDQKKQSQRTTPHLNSPIAHFKPL
jgi:hypothetical protein